MAAVKQLLIKFFYNTQQNEGGSSKEGCMYLVPSDLPLDTLYGTPGYK